MDPNIKSGTSILSPFHEIHSTETKLEPISEPLAKSVDKIDHVAEATIHAIDHNPENSTATPHSLDLLNSYHSDKLQNDLLNQLRVSIKLNDDLDFDIDFDIDIERDAINEIASDSLQTVDYKDTNLETKETKRAEIKEANDARIDTVNLRDNIVNEGVKVVSARLANVRLIDPASIKHIDASKLPRLTDDLDKGRNALKAKTIMEVDLANKKAYVPRGSGIAEGTVIECDGEKLTVSYMTEDQERSLLEDWDQHVTTSIAPEIKQEVQEEKAEGTKHKDIKRSVDNDLPTRAGKEKEIAGGWISNRTFTPFNLNSDIAKVEHRKNEKSALEHDIKNEEDRKEIRKEHIRKDVKTADALKQKIMLESQHSHNQLADEHHMVVIPRHKVA